MDTRKRLHTSRPIWASESADVVETAMIEIDTEGHEYREIEGAEGRRAAGADNNPKGSRAAGQQGMTPDGAEAEGLKTEGHEAVL